MSCRWIEISANLGKCRKIAKILKQKFPKLVMDLNDNTIVVYRKHSRFCYPNGREMSKDAVAHEHPNFSPRYPLLSGVICIKQNFLFFPWSNSSYRVESIPKYHSVVIFGNWSLIDIMCHEIAHFLGSSNRSIHGKKWYNIFLKFLRQMALEVISGNYYTWYTNHYKVIN